MIKHYKEYSNIRQIKIKGLEEINKNEERIIMDELSEQEKIGRKYLMDYRYIYVNFGRYIGQ